MEIHQIMAVILYSSSKFHVTYTVPTSMSLQQTSGEAMNCKLKGDVGLDNANVVRWTHEQQQINLRLNYLKYQFP